MKRCKLILLIAFVSAGCGNGNIEKTDTSLQQKQGSEGNIGVKPNNVEEAIEVVSLDDGSIYIECQYTDRKIVNYKFLDNKIFFFSTTDNKYLENYVYGIGLYPKLNWFVPTKVQMTENNFSIEGEDPAAHTKNQISINRKTGSMTDTTYVFGMGASFVTADCNPSTSSVIEQNSF